MSISLNESVHLLNNLLSLSRTTTSVVDQARLDTLVAGLAVTALEEVDRFTAEAAAEAQAAAQAVTDAEAEAARHAIEEEERAAQALVQEAEDQAQREERHAAGVS